MASSPPRTSLIITGRKLNSMFTGIVQGLATVKAFNRRELALNYLEVDEGPWKLGESVAINGCCLTLVSTHDDLCFELSEETLARTTMNFLVPGAPVNVERAMKPSDRFGGHFLQGHVDAVGSLESVSGTEQSNIMKFSVPAAFKKYLVDKGSIAIDGVSPTVVEPSDAFFHVAVIPHTWQNTNLSRLLSGSAVNVEFDMIAKYIERLTSTQ